MDWQIKSISKKSSQSGVDLKPGDVVVSILRQNEAGDLERSDFLKSELEQNPYNGKFLAKWERVVSENPQEDERQARRLALSGSESLFISLFDDESLDIEQKDALKQMLALLLERKRILRAKGRVKNGFQLYVHTASKREFLVRQCELNEELILNIQSQLESFVI